MNTLLNVFDADVTREPQAMDTLTSSSAQFGFSQTLPLELALRTAPEQDILAAYNISEFEYEALCRNPAFVAALKHAHELVQKDGMSFKLKARLQADELLGESYRLIHDKEVPPSVRADLIKSTVRWSGFDTPEPVGQQQNVNPIQININLG